MDLFHIVASPASGFILSLTILPMYVWLCVFTLVFFVI